MTSEGLGEMFEGDSADMCIGKFPLTLMGGLSGGSRVRRPGSEDPHRRERKFFIFLESVQRLLVPMPLFLLYISK
jgi:hypothetical protein